MYLIKDKRRFILFLGSIAILVTIVSAVFGVDVYRNNTMLNKPSNKFGKLPEELPIGSAMPAGEKEAGLTFDSTAVAIKISQLPRSIPVYKVSGDKINIESLSKKLGFLGEPEKSEDEVIYRTDNSMFRYSVSRAYLEYYNGYGEKTKGPPTPDVDSLKSAAKNFLVENSIYKSVDEFKEARAQFLKVVGMETTTTTNQFEADYLELYYSSVLSGAPVIAAGTDIYPTVVTLDFNGKVNSIRHYTYSFDTKELSYYSLKDAKDMLKDIEAGKAILVSYDEGDLTLPQFQKVVFYDVALGYLMPQGKDDIFRPVLILYGGGETTNKVSYKAVFYLSATQ